MTKYKLLLKKIQDWKKDSYYSTYNFNSAELEIILDALETVQFLEIIFKERISQQKLETYE